MNLRRILWITAVCLLAGCGKASEPETKQTCPVVLEEGEGFTADKNVCRAERGTDAVFYLSMEEGYELLEADDMSCEIRTEPDGTICLTLPNVRYPKAITLSVRKSDCIMTYHANGGEKIGGKGEETVKIPVVKTHLRVNTSLGTDLFEREGHTLIGWNTSPDGSGIFTGLGSRVFPEEAPVLYAVWSPWTKEECFEWKKAGNYALITSYHGEDREISIPKEIRGFQVIGIEEDAFSGSRAKTVVLPETIQRIENGAFRNSAVETLYLSDNLLYVNDSSFENCENLKTLHINAVKAPVYSGSYYDSFQDKYDYLLSVKDEKKLVLFSGSSARFGYDSPWLEREFPEYRVVNMGVFAYTNAAPQFLLLEKVMKEGDILLHSPEFDARQRQFCTTSSLDDKFFCMMESNYDAVAELDLRQVEGVMNAFYTFLNTRQGMKGKSYRLSVKEFDEDGNPVQEDSYNQQGDYILYRPNAQSVEPVYGLPVEYTKASFPKEIYFAGANRMYQRFLEKGVRVYLTYAPRNRYALSKDSTKEARAELHHYLEEQLVIPVISDIEESLYPGTYLYGTDNHLSTEGVKIRTERIIRDLRKQMEKEQ